MAYESPFFRADLIPFLNKRFCGQELAPKHFLLEGVLDASISGALIKSSFEKKNTNDKVINKIKSLAKKRAHNGYSFAACDKNSFWYVTVPLGKAIKRESLF